VVVCDDFSILMYKFFNISKAVIKKQVLHVFFVFFVNPPEKKNHISIPNTLLVSSKKRKN
jgi:hypothetical protein